MGYDLTGAVLASGFEGRAVAYLNPNARLILLGMSAVAHDKGTATKPRAQYWGGWDWLAKACLGRDVYDRAAEKAVGRAIRELIDAGLIKPVGRLNGERQGNAIYELTL